jgi:hypothetical protein
MQFITTFSHRPFLIASDKLRAAMLLRAVATHFQFSMADVKYIFLTAIERIIYT